ncbi:MAG: hypothetical protein QM772_14470 [Ottowia sp.]|uniref:hypothetical protein n=1 Tax=Ottowia sp. TaxID=1898956 RepID=UPI0039E29D14
MTARNDVPIYGRLEAIAVLHAIFLLILSLKQGFFPTERPLIVVWVDNWWMKAGVFVVFWIVAPYFYRITSGRKK